MENKEMYKKIKYFFGFGVASGIVYFLFYTLSTTIGPCSPAQFAVMITGQGGTILYILVSIVLALLATYSKKTRLLAYVSLVIFTVISFYVMSTQTKVCNEVPIINPASLIETQ